MQDVQSPIVFHLSTQSVDDVAISEQLEALRERGFTLIHYSCFASLSSALTQAMPASGWWFGLVCLTGPLSELLMHTMRLRMSYPRLCIVLQSDWSENAFLQALQNGADMLIPSHSSADLIASCAYGMFRRQLPASLIDTQQSRDLWRFEQDGWVLSSPCGQTFSLTSAERSFFLCLLNNTERQASHTDLLRAINERAGVRPPSEPVPLSYSLTDINRLGVLVSRVRRKFDRHDIDLPIRSIHNWGYMFAAECQVPSRVSS